MGKESNILPVMVLAGVALLLGQGCTAKSFRSMVGSESMETSGEYAESDMGQRDPHSGYLQDGTWEVAREPNDGYQQDGVWDVAQGRFVPAEPPKSVGEHISQNPGGFPELGEDSKRFDESIALLPDFGTNVDESGAYFDEGAPMAEEFVQNTMVAEAQPQLSFNQGQYPSNQSQVPGYSPGGRSFPGGASLDYSGEGSQDFSSGIPQGYSEESQEGYPDVMQEYSYQNGVSGDHRTIQVELQDVFFQYDSWNVSEEGAQALVHDATWLGENSERSLTVEGHCDQRGTSDYNMALGQKRAEAVRTYLLDLGVEADQIQVVSYGKERPFCFGSDERCMQLNRRGHLNLHRQ